MQTLTLSLPDDWHLHLRDRQALAATVPAAARQFGRGLPNLRPPVVSVAQALSYRQRILAARPADSTWEPLMTLYLTDDTPPAELRKARDSGLILGVKYYPAGATTNSDCGVTRLERVYPQLAAMEELGLPLLLHGEVADPDVDIFDREAVFIERELAPLRARFPALRLVLEHVTTSEGVAFVADAPAHVAATITPQHLLFDRNQLLAGGIRPHYYCLPILKRAAHRRALIAAATGGSGKFFLGTDSAPHAKVAKEAACGCAGCFSHHAALELYATAFEEAGALDRLEGFASHFGADYYGLPRNRDTVTLERRTWRLPEELDLGGEPLVPLAAGQELAWRMIDRRSGVSP
jgi:dihydroorotase